MNFPKNRLMRIPLKTNIEEIIKNEPYEHKKIETRYVSPTV